MAQSKRGPARALVAPLLAGFVGLASIGGIAVVRRAERVGGPTVGDLLDFPPSATGSLVAPSVTAIRVTGGTCTLDVATMQRDGGSLAVLERRVAGSITLRVSWVGHRTAEGEQDCGQSADLLIDRPAAIRLLYATGG